MKKIMFNDRYGLTWSVLKGKKTMTRRLFKAPLAVNVSRHRPPSDVRNLSRHRHNSQY